MRVPFDEMKSTLQRILLGLSFTADCAERCAHIFAANSRDGVYSHGLNRFPVFAEYLRQGLVDPQGRAILVERQGSLEIWDGQRGPGMLGASDCMARAISLAMENAIGCVTIRNNNHWMRGGSYGLQAVEAGCIGICFTNAMAGMVPWGGREPRLGNNPLVIAMPNGDKPILLDMAISQFSYGKMQQYEWEKKDLPFYGGWDEAGQLILDPALIRKNKSALPIGFWKGSGLALLLDMLLTSIGGGLSTAAITRAGKELGLSQCFICIRPRNLHQELVEEIIEYTKSAIALVAGEGFHYPGERMLAIRKENQQLGIPVHEPTWRKIQEM